MENLYPTPPLNQGQENGAFWLQGGFIFDLGGWGFAVPFYSVQDCSPWAHKKILRGGNIKTKSAAVAFFSSLPFFLLALSIFPFLVLFQADFWAHFAFGFWSFSQSKDCNFHSVRFLKSSKIMLWVLQLPIYINFNYYSFKIFPRF